MKEVIAEKGAAYLNSADLIPFLFGEVAKKYQDEIISLVNSGDYPDQKVLPETVLTKYKAFYELGKRTFKVGVQKITTCMDIYHLCSDIGSLKQEQFQVISLNGNNSLISRRTISIGTLNSTLVHPREVFVNAITDFAAQIILVHNHPSGNLEPSQEDINITARLIETGKIVGIEVKDHIIIAGDTHFSFLANRMI